MRYLFEKRARDYNSDDEEEEEKEDTVEEAVSHDTPRGRGGDLSFEGSDDSEGEEQGGGEIQPGIMRFTEGSCIIRDKQLVAKKLTEEEAERKVKGEAKKEKHLDAEKGHVKPANYLDSQEKFLIGIATKRVVKLFNAVNKAQKAQKGLDPSRSKDAKVIRKRRKEAFFSELGKTSLPARDYSSKGNTSSDSMNDEGPAWAPLRDNYMLTNPKLKDWDKMADSAIVDDVGRMSVDSGSDDD
ncbi:RRP15-like protein [Gossypium arboreum]|uniref:RRP15-like protein n=1 Tax=Gossypium arboreum TaxID=29729 RepID=A0A0B0N9Z4_GOSAR|nr:RRP15-like protein [Gossypium arboreum]